MSDTAKTNFISFFNEKSTYRDAEHPVSPIFVNRWSPRAYSDKPVELSDIYTLLEAARWAPSSSNLQPWRFVIAATEEHLELFRSFIRPVNRRWTNHVPALILIASSKLRADGEPNGAHAFDTGAAWASIALQAHLLGLSTRAIGGFDRERAREALSIPESYELHAVIALGYRGDKSLLDEDFQKKEKPNGRRPLQESIFHGVWTPQQ